MMRANAATTRMVRELLDTSSPGDWWAWDKRSGLRAGAVMLFSTIGGWIGDRQRRLPDGRAVSELTATEESLDEYLRHVRRCRDRWLALTGDFGLRTVLVMLACEAVWHCRRWWLVPTWPVMVEALLARTGDMPRELGRCYCHADSRDERNRVSPDVLRARLLAGPDRLDPELARWCEAGLARIGLDEAGIRKRAVRPSYLALLDPEMRSVGIGCAEAQGTSRMTSKTPSSSAQTRVQGSYD